ncbi:MAG: hypothetical protein KatS3mg080_0874 [Anoxybacillus sp.]|nr:MAG: hypothetical protein KatS3mg080_0874 [Anoxybacillus sp.]
MVGHIDELIKLIDAGNLKEAKNQFCEKAIYMHFKTMTSV